MSDEDVVRIFKYASSKTNILCATKIISHKLYVFLKSEGRCSLELSRVLWYFCMDSYVTFPFGVLEMMQRCPRLFVHYNVIEIYCLAYT